MLAPPQPSHQETRANQAFEALLWALSRPGMIRSLPESGEAQVIAALLDRECAVHAADPRLMPLILQSGAQLAEIDAADHIFLGRPSDAHVLRAVPQGTDLYPDDGATLIVQADLGEGATLRLSGPGVNGALEVQVGGLPDGFWQHRAEIMRYPMGFEIFLLDGDRVMGLPRSTKIEVL